MASFSEAELGYLQSERRLARLATTEANGQPHVVPVGMWHYNPDLGTIDVTGHDFAASRKFRNVQANPKAALIVDDLASVDPWRPRAVLVQGHAQAVQGRPGAHEAIIRIIPDKIVSWGLDADRTTPDG